MLGILLEICQEAIVLIFYFNVENDFDMTSTLTESLFVCMRSAFIISLFYAVLKNLRKKLWILDMNVILWNLVLISIQVKAQHFKSKFKVQQKYLKYFCLDITAFYEIEIKYAVIENCCKFSDIWYKMLVISKCLLGFCLHINPFVNQLTPLTN